MRPGDRIDQFEVLDTLGGGAFATTYLARDVQTGERVMLKCPAPATLADPESAALFQREATITRRLRHPNIQGAARSLVARDSPYLAMEYVEGESLRRRLQAGGPFSVGEALGVVAQIAAHMAHTG
jgi:serine/threonine-protein kinase